MTWTDTERLLRNKITAMDGRLRFSYHTEMPWGDLVDGAWPDKAGQGYSQITRAEIVFRGETAFNPSDTYLKSTGREIALSRAFLMMFPHRTGPAKELSARAYNTLQGGGTPPPKPVVTPGQLQMRLDKQVDKAVSRGVRRKTSQRKATPGYCALEVPPRREGHMTYESHYQEIRTRTVDVSDEVLRLRSLWVSQKYASQTVTLKYDYVIGTLNEVLEYVDTVLDNAERAGSVFREGGEGVLPCASRVDEWRSIRGDSRTHGLVNIMPELLKYVKIRRLGDAENVGIFAHPDDIVVVEEKVDGANFRFMRGKRGVVFGSRNNMIGSWTPEDGLVLTQKGFTKAAQFVVDTLQEDASRLNKDYVYFGEAMHKHTIPYDFENTPAFIGFDIWVDSSDSVAAQSSSESGGYLPHGAKKDAFERIGLPVVPLRWAGALRDMPHPDDLESFIGKSSLPGDVNAEGVTIKSYSRLNGFGRQMFAKIVSDDFKEVNNVVFGSNKKSLDSSAMAAEEYATPARIRKTIERLRDESGVPVTMRLMVELHPAVSEDILREEIINIFNSKNYRAIDFGLFRKFVASKCVVALKNYLAERATADLVVDQGEPE